MYFVVVYSDTEPDADAKVVVDGGTDAEVIIYIDAVAVTMPMSDIVGDLEGVIEEELVPVSFIVETPMTRWTKTTSG